MRCLLDVIDVDGGWTMPEVDLQRACRVSGS